ncbi:Ldh family oxidoreductase, partial [Mesorhizobium sp.]|uniref:Ldh family oxidoreductase n=1 Tax=Mesorhizobium sp. TaxID=1871066 RepID=UPI0025E987CB
MTNTTITIDALHERVDAIFRKAGLNPIQASAITRVIVAAERDACKSHGIYRIEGALRTIKAGKVKPDALPELLPQDAPALVKVDAKHGFANPAFELGLPARSARADPVRRLGW